MEVLAVGNAAKLYCLNWIEDHIRLKEGQITILDLGCGSAGGFVALLKKHPQVHYVGLEPSKRACLQAKHNLKGLNASIVNAYGYSVKDRLREEFDVVVSFSVLEHVHKRADYLTSARDCLKCGGYFLINYDAGHFVLGTRRDRVKNVVGPLLARVGIERYYQSFVKEQEFRDVVKHLGLKIVDEKFFNTGLKGVYKAVPDSVRAAYMEKWLDLELWLNGAGIPYDDAKARTFVTRNFILQHEWTRQL